MKEYGKEQTFASDEKLICAKCRVPLESGDARFTYLDNGFPVKLPVCPSCGFVYVSEELALTKVLAVEKSLEDK